jgi:seryl-tRNA synthetase
VIDLRQLRLNPAAFRGALERRLDASLMPVVERILEADRRRRDVLGRVEALKAERNQASEEVARLKRERQPADDLMARLKASADEVKSLDAELRVVDAELEGLILGLPNLPLATVPDGDGAGNRELRRWGDIRTFPYMPQTHWDLGAKLGLFDLPRGAKVTGSGFPIFLGAGARLVRALGNFMLDLHTREHGYTEVAPPFLVNRATMTGTGQLPKFEEELYRLPDDDLFLIPTSEVPVTNLHRDEILDAALLPLTYTALTPCFRREAGAHGKDTRGLIRVHQFDKVELVRITRPEDSVAEHELITRHAEAVLHKLNLPYRVVHLAAGDTGFASASTYDLEVWAPGVGSWLEVSSSSTFTDFQARRANIRYRPSAGAKPEFVHTLNASGLAFPRTIIAILENYQDPDGSVRIPDALVPFMGVDRLRPRA